MGRRRDSYPRGLAAGLLPIVTILTSVILAAVYTIHAKYGLAVMVAIAGCVWLIGQRLGWGWLASPMLVFFVVLAAFGVWDELGSGWMLIAMVAALSAWDLHHYVSRITKADWAIALERQHLRRLLYVDILSLLLTTAALNLRLTLDFTVALSLAALAIVALSRVVGYLRRESSE